MTVIVAGRCLDCGQALDVLGFERGGSPKSFHTHSRCHTSLVLQLKAERDLVEGLEDMVGLTQIAEHCQDFEEIEKCRERLEELYEARKKVRPKLE
jgi:hypothetical protein